MMKSPISVHLLTIIIFLWASHLAHSQTNDSADQIINNYLTSKSEYKSIKTHDLPIVEDRLDQNAPIRHIQTLQKHEGIYIKGAMLSIVRGPYKKDIILDKLVDNLGNIAPPSIDGREAILKSLAFHNIPVNEKLSIRQTLSKQDKHMKFNRLLTTANEPQVRLMYVKAGENKFKLVWETQLQTADRQHYWVSYLDAQSGQILEYEDLVLHCEFGEGLVYDASREEEILLEHDRHHRHMKAAELWDKMKALKSPDKSDLNFKSALHSSMMGPANTYRVLDLPAEAPNDITATNTQTLVTTSGDPVASPFGWTSTDGVNENNHTKGNNVWAFHDPSPGPLGGAPSPTNGAMSTAGTPGVTPQTWDYLWDLTQEPEYSTTDVGNQFPNRNAAIVNLFYWNNIIHDVFYNFGFTEAGRNFQVDNFGKGGVGNDEVLAQAQDGGGTNNANFLTLADGVNGQMQMYLWTPSTLQKLVKISNVSSNDGLIQSGDEFVAIQGALYNSAMPIDLNANPVLGKELVLVNDADPCPGGGNSEGCGLGGGVGTAPCNDVTNKIVLIDRGSCSFVEKVDGAQKGGAAGVIVMNNNSSSPDEILAMGGTDPTVNTITIPAVMVSYNTGLLLKGTLDAGVTITGGLQQDAPLPPKRDGDFDNGIIAHEYGHGITIRTSPQTATGGSLSGSEQGGEGWADYIGIYLTMTQSNLAAPTLDHPNGVLPNRGIGTYVTYADYDGPGIRPRRYSIDESVNEYTFVGETNGGKGIGNSGEITIPHGVGFIWCTMLYEMTQSFIDLYGFNDDVAYNPPVIGNQASDIATLISNTAGNNVAMKLILEGIRLQEPSPRFTDMRDGILMADSLYYDGAHSCMIWEAFAKRGLGVDATDLSNDIGDESDGFGVPVSCNPSQVYYRIEKTAPTSIGNNCLITYELIVCNTSVTGTDGTNIAVKDSLPDNMSFQSATGAPFTHISNVVNFTIDTLKAGEKDTLTLTALVHTLTESLIAEEYQFEQGSEEWTTIPGSSNEWTRENDESQAYGGSSYYFCPNNGLNSSNAFLISPMYSDSLFDSQLRFWHKFGTDAGYDGGFVEVTSDLVTWTRLPLQVNDYNGDLNSTFNPDNAGDAFTGTVVDYIESAGTLPDGTLQIRFVFSEDNGFGSGDGWYVDNIRIVENPTNVLNTATVVDPVMSGGRTKTSTFSSLVVPDIIGCACVSANPPFIIGKNATVELDISGTASIDTSLVLDSVTAECGLDTVYLDQIMFDCSDLGANTVSIIAGDGSGKFNSTEVTVTVEDNLSPTLTTKDATLYLDENGLVQVDSTDVVASISDNCGTVSLSIDPDDLDCNMLGLPQMVMVTAIDASGNQESLMSSVTVLDTIKPTMVCKNITVTLDSDGSQEISAAQLLSSVGDNCGIPTISASKTTFSCDDVGSEVITVTTQDASGNSRMCQSNVTIEPLVELVITDALLSSLPGQELFLADEKITSDAEIINRNLVFKAGMELILNPNFLIEISAELEIYIEGCN